MDTNVKFTAPNLAICLKDHQLKHYNLVWGKEHYTPGMELTSFIDTLLVKTSTGDIVPPTYPTTVEMQTQVDSLDYDGEFFWSVQALNSTPYYPGWIVSKWQVNPDLYALDKLQFKAFPGFDSAGSLAVEWYTFTMREGTDPTRNWISVDTSYEWILDRIRVGDRLKVGPNNRDEEFWGTISRIQRYPENPYYDPLWYDIYFTENLNSSYVAGEDVFVEAGIFVFAGSSLYRLSPGTLSTLEKYDSNIYSNVTACAFSVINHVPSINVGMKVPSLFFVRDMSIYCKPISDLGSTLAAQVLETNFNREGNSCIQVHELRVRNDNPDSLDNYPQHYLLQKEYREDRDPSTNPQEWSTYNYILKNLHSQPAIMVVDVQPQFATQSGIVSCSCQILDSYNFPVPNVQVTWSHACGANAYFLDPTTSGTDANGFTYNRLFLINNLTFPAYVTATTDEL